MAAVLVTLSSMECPFKHEHFNFSVLQKGFKKYSRNIKFLLYILSLTRQIYSCASNPLSRVKSTLARQIYLDPQSSVIPCVRHAPVRHCRPWWNIRLPLFGQYFTFPPRLSFQGQTCNQKLKPIRYQLYSFNYIHKYKTKYHSQAYTSCLNKEPLLVVPQNSVR